MTNERRNCPVCGRELPLTAFHGGMCRVCRATAHVRPGDLSYEARRRMADSFRRLRVRDLLANRTSYKEAV